MIEKEKFLQALRSPLQSARNYRLHHFASQRPKLYFSTVLTLALVGYGFLLLFPVLALIAVMQLAETAQTSPFTLSAVSQGLVWFAVFIFAIAISHHIFTVKFDLPKGVNLPPNRAPALFALLEDDKGYRFWPKFQGVLLSEHFELEILKTPLIGIPLWSKNTLVIGFPMMQTLSQPHFDCALLRKLLQYSKGRNLVTNWLLQLRDIWFLYPAAFSRRKLLGEQLIAGFFRLYAPLYKKLSLYAAQQEELAADTLALREMNDADLFKTLQSQAIATYFYHHNYLPMLSAFVREKAGNPNRLTPYSSLPGLFRRRVDDNLCKQWLDAFAKQNVNTRSITPPLSQRMSNIGHSKLRPPKVGQHSAAEHYFAAYYGATAQFMDNVWRRKLSRLHNRKTPQRRQQPCLQARAAVS